MKAITKAGLGAVGALSLLLLQAVPAHADGQAQATDVVGVGSDTVQYGLDFLAEGDSAGHAGFNTGSLNRRVFNLDATGDAAGKATAGAQVVLRAGAKPVARPNGSGAGIGALIADTGATEQINFVRSSRLPTTGEQTQASVNGWTGLHVYQFATDGLALAVSNLSPTNVPATVTPADLVCIYQGQNTSTGACPQFSAIVPYLPQTGSGTRNFFLADLQAANGGTAITLGTNVRAMEEHDPTLIQSDPNAIGPFSTGRLALLNSGYFGAGSVNAVKTVSGAGSYSTTRPLFVIVRDRDVNDTTGVGGIAFPWQVGGTRNWVKTLFSGTTSWIARSSNNPLIASAGLAPSYSDLGLAHS